MNNNLVYVLFDCPKQSHRIYCGVFDSMDSAEAGKAELLEEEKKLGLINISDYVIFPVRLNALGL